jgi:hypothetical protein
VLLLIVLFEPVPLCETDKVPVVTIEAFNVNPDPKYEPDTFIFPDMQKKTTWINLNLFILLV